MTAFTGIRRISGLTVSGGLSENRRGADADGGRWGARVASVGGSNALNIPSRKAAQRLGFSYEGIFRQALVVKGRNRDTAWFAIIDKEWPALQEAYQAWLSPANFTREGMQRESLADLTRLVRATSDPML